MYTEGRRLLARLLLFPVLVLGLGMWCETVAMAEGVVTEDIISECISETEEMDTAQDLDEIEDSETEDTNEIFSDQEIELTALADAEAEELIDALALEEEQLTEDTEVPVIMDDEEPEAPYRRYKIDEKELFLFAALIQCEAVGESYRGQVAVGSVVLNRVDSKLFPSTITDVIYQKGQFSPVRNGSLKKVLNSGKVDESCMKAAIEALEGALPVGDVLFFRRNNGRKGTLIGHHIFY